MAPGPVVHLIGYPAAGKRTVALAMAAAAAQRGHHLVVVDNHLTGNPVLSVVDHGGTNPPPEVWSLVYEIRELVCQAIQRHSPPSWSFVFTNVLTNEGDTDRDAVPRLRRLAAARGCRYLPVVLTCDVDELARRATAEGRAEQHKLVDPMAVRTSAMTRTLQRPAGAIEIDVSTRPPEETAELILGAAGMA